MFNRINKDNDKLRFKIFCSQVAILLIFMRLILKINLILVLRVLIHNFFIYTIYYSYSSVLKVWIHALPLPLNLKLLPTFSKLNNFLNIKPTRLQKFLQHREKDALQFYTC